MAIVKLLDGIDKAYFPKYESDLSSGIDLYCVEEVTIKPKAWTLVSTGVTLDLPGGLEAQVRSRSGMALKQGITVMNSPGTIDSDYTGEVKVILLNHNETEVIVKKGTRVAQLVFAEVVRVKECLLNTSGHTRGDGGFGSTGYA